MAKAGFWSIGGYVISFRRDGHWYADEDRIENKKIEKLFSAHIQSDGADGYVVDVGIDRQPVTVEDTPLVVKSIGRREDGHWEVTTNDDVSSVLAIETLSVGEQDVLYCVVEREGRGSLRARFLRPAYYELLRHVEFEGESAIVTSPDGRCVLGANLQES